MARGFRPRRRLVVVAVALMLVAAVAGVWLTRRSASVAQATTTTVKATTTTLSQIVTASGTIAPKVRSDLSFTWAGTVTSVAVKAGDQVSAGQTLASIDPTELQQAVDSAQASVDAADASLSATKSSSSATSNQIAAARSQVKAANAKLETAKTALAAATLQTPVTGIVAAVNIQVGNQVSGSGSGAGSGTGSGSSSGQSSSGSAGSAGSSSSASSGQIVVISTDAWVVDTWLLAAAAVVVAGGTAIANGFPGGGPATSQYRTALVESGTVRQTLSLSGTAARVGEVTVGWPMSGTVARVDVSVGQQVTAGQQLATMDTAPLQQAVLDDQVQVDQARVTLDADEGATASQSDQTSSSTASSSAPHSTSGSGGAAATPSTTRASGGSGVPGRLDTSGLAAATGKVDQAQKTAATACAPLLATSPSNGTPVASTSSQTIPSTRSSTATDPTAPTTTTSSEPPPSPPTSSSSSTTTSPTTDLPTAGQVSACLAALQAVSSAQSQAGSTIDSLAAQLAKAATAAASSASPGSSGSGTSGGKSGSGSGGQTSGSSGSGSSEAKLILDQAVLTSAEAALSKANDQLAAAILTAPATGVVGSVSLVAGSSTAANTGIVIVTPSAATLTVQVPLANLSSVAVGQAASVTPSGGGSLGGSVSSISLLPTASSTGSSATTYAVVVDVPAATDALAVGAKASVTIETSRVDNVLTVPVSAVTSVATGTGSVSVLRDGAVSQTTVRTGSVGQGKVQVLSGLTAGQTVVLADTSQALPSNNGGIGSRAGAGAGAGGLAGGAGGGLPGTGGAPGGTPGAGPGR